LGYLEGVKGYRLLNPSIEKIFIERSVKFEEDPLHALEEYPATVSSPQIVVDLLDDSSSTTYQISDQISESDLNDHDHRMDDPEISPKWA
jgi:hypothetical protein